MKTLMRSVLLLGLVTGLMTGCNTMAGLGKDIKTAGDKIEDAAKKK
jgi:predicted small secreted protein